MRILIITLATLLAGSVAAQVPTTLDDFFLPGSQPLESGQIKTLSDCGCHDRYDIAVEPSFNWQGSMMSQAARDPIFYASMTIAEQDAPNSGDLCIRCHSPKAWLEGRSTPTDGSALTQDDRESVTCHFCHKAIKPGAVGVNPYPADPDYTATTYAADQAYLSTMSARPDSSANGMFVVANVDIRRGPYTDADAPHNFYYSPFHQESGICGTCHDVSNPAFSADGTGDYVPNSFGAPAPDTDPHSMFPIERTFSEWRMSDYNTPAGVYAPQFGGNIDTVRSCQDCHMRDVTGKGCSKGSAPIRDDLALHDMTGGNTFMPRLIDNAFPSDNVDAAAIDSGIVRARRMLQLAASMQLTAAVTGNQHELEVRITNETGHKLPSGYPEGRRVWINVKAYDGGDQLVYESAAYDTASALLTKDADAKIYEIKPGISGSLSPIVGLPAEPGFHFVLNDTIYKDNRIPARGFTNTNYDLIQSPVVAYSYSDGQYWDNTVYLIPGQAERLEVTLYYQTTSKEFIEFLRDENTTNHWGDSLFSWWEQHGKSAPEVMVADTIMVTPVATNTAPQIAAIDDEAVAENQLLSFTVAASDGDGDPITLGHGGLPDGASFTDNGNGTGDFSWTPTFDQAGTWPVVFVATDGSASDSEQVLITVTNVNRPPALAGVDNQSYYAGESISIDITATDPDGSIPSIVADQRPAAALFTDHGDGTAALAWIPDTVDAGIHPISLIASDGDLADTIAFTIEVLTPQGCCVASTGDLNGDSVDADPIDLSFFVDYLFAGGTEPACPEEADVNGDGELGDPIDLSYFVDFLFTGGAAPEPCP